MEQLQMNQLYQQINTISEEIYDIECLLKIFKSYIYYDDNAKTSDIITAIFIVSKLVNKLKDKVISLKNTIEQEDNTNRHSER